jgi:transcriptional regulator with XRE-family HTH domain
MGKAATTLNNVLSRRSQDESARLLGCTQPWISRLLRLKARPSREFLEKAKLVWPEIDIEASEEEYMDPRDLAARRARSLARLVLAVPEPEGSNPTYIIGAGYFERLRSAAREVIEVSRG